MNNTTEAREKLAKRALRRAKSTTIPVTPMMNLNRLQGMVLSDMKFSVKLSKSEMLGLVKSQIDYDELFEDMEVEEFDLTEAAQRICDQVMDKLWPRKGASNRLFDKEGIEELKPLTQELDGMRGFLEKGKKDDATIAAMREKLKAIKGGRYTFLFKVMVYVGASHCRYCDPNDEEVEIETPWQDSTWNYSCDYAVPVKIKVTAQEVLGFLYGLYPYKCLFDGLCEKPLDGNYFCSKAEGIPCASAIPLLMEPAPDGPRCVIITNFGLLYPIIDAWIFIIETILEGGRIYDKYTFDSFLKYFDYIRTCEDDEPIYFVEDYYDQIWS